MKPTRNFWSGSTADMVKMAKLAYPIIHSDPHSMLLTPSVAGPVGNAARDSGSVWMAAYLDTGGAAYADGGAFHGYIARTGTSPFPMPEEDVTAGCEGGTTCFGSIITKTTMMRQVFDEHGLKGKPMFDTEGGWGNGNITDPDQQAAWLARWYLLQAGLSSVDNLKVAAWYAWGRGASQTWGTIESDSTALTPAAVAYNQVYNWLVNAGIPQPCAGAPSGVWTCTLEKPGGYKALAVWDVHRSGSYAPPAGYRRYGDLAGNAIVIEAGTKVTIGAKPILLEKR
jgi:hypothetical protein